MGRKTQQTEPEVPQLEGYDARLNEFGAVIYHCTEPSCNKTYVRQGVAVKHAEYHQAQKDNPIETLKVEIAKEKAEQATGGDILRELADEIEKGVLNIPEITKKLRMSGMIVDSLLKEIEKADLRTLTHKARSFDLIVGTIASHAEIMKEVKDASEQG